MNCKMLGDELVNWLQREKIEFNRESESIVNFHTTGDHGRVWIRILCEEDPPTLQMVCPFPLRVPQAKMAETALLLHNLNAPLRIGSFHLITESRMILFRLTLPINSAVDLAGQFSTGVGTATSVTDEHLQTLAFFVCDTPEVAKVVASLKPAKELIGVINCPVNEGRVQFN